MTRSHKNNSMNEISDVVHMLNKNEKLSDENRSKLLGYVQKQLNKSNYKIKSYNQFSSTDFGYSGVSGTLSVTITRNDVLEFLNNPDENWEGLILLSDYMYSTSNLYKSLVNYLAEMGLYRFIIDKNIQGFVNNDTSDVSDIKLSIEDSVLRANRFTNKFRWKQQGRMIAHNVIKYGVFYGFVDYSENYNTIVRLPIGICRHMYTYKGVPQVSIDMSLVTEEIASTLPYKIRKAYYKYLEADGKLGDIFTLGVTEGLVIKSDPTSVNQMPYFTDLILDIMDIDEYKEIKKERAKDDNYKLLTLQIPLANDDLNSPEISGDLAIEIMSIAAAILPEDYGILPTPMKSDLLQSKRDTADTNHVKDATKYAIDNAGISQAITFDEIGDAIPYAVEKDATLIYSIYRQIELWQNMTMFRKNINSRYMLFEIRFLDMTIYNKYSVIDNLESLGERGLPVKEELYVAHGGNLLSLIGQDMIENRILEIDKYWKPLSTSYTQSADSQSNDIDEEVADEEVVEDDLEE